MNVTESKWGELVSKLDKALHKNSLNKKEPKIWQIKMTTAGS